MIMMSYQDNKSTRNYKTKSKWLRLCCEDEGHSQSNKSKFRHI